MAREKFHTLTEQMFYILLCLTKEQCGTDLMSAVSALTGGRVIVGPGTLYNLLEQFQTAGMIEETKVEGRRRSYRRRKKKRRRRRSTGVLSRWQRTTGASCRRKERRHEKEADLPAGLLLLL